MSGVVDLPQGVTRHAMDRLAEHHGVVATPEEWAAAALSVVEGDAVLVRRDFRLDGSIYSETYLVRLGGKVVEAVWKAQDAVFVTVLQPNSRSRSTRFYKTRKCRLGRPPA